MSLLDLADSYLGSAAASYREANNYPRPICRVVVAGKDITAAVVQRLVSIDLTDNRGIEADQLDITLSDHDGLLAIPPRAPPCSCGWAGVTPASSTRAATPWTRPSTAARRTCSVFAGAASTCAAS